MFDTFSGSSGPAGSRGWFRGGKFVALHPGQRAGGPERRRPGLPPSASTPVWHLRERRDQTSRSDDIQSGGFAEPWCRLGDLLERARAHRGRPSRARGALFVASTRRMPGGVSPRACDVVSDMDRDLGHSVATRRPSSLKSSNRPASASRSRMYLQLGRGDRHGTVFGRNPPPSPHHEGRDTWLQTRLGTAKSGAGHSVWFRPFNHCYWSATSSIQEV